MFPSLDKTPALFTASLELTKVPGMILIAAPSFVITCEDKVREIWLDEKIVDKTTKGDLCTLPVGTFLRPSDKLYKWIDSKEIPVQSD